MSNDTSNRGKFHGERGSTRTRVGAGGTVRLDPPIYRAYMAPEGFLNSDIPCHALFHYFVTAAENYRESKEGVKLEGERDSINLHGLFFGVAKLYGVDPNDMEKYWPAVDLQARKLGLTLLPREPKWRSPKKGLM